MSSVTFHNLPPFLHVRFRAAGWHTHNYNTIHHLSRISLPPANCENFSLHRPPGLLPRGGKKLLTPGQYGSGCRCHAARGTSCQAHITIRRLSTGACIAAATTLEPLAADLTAAKDGRVGEPIWADSLPGSRQEQFSSRGFLHLCRRHAPLRPLSPASVGEGCALERVLT